MAHNPPSRPPRDPLATVVDRLLEKLPGADPTLRGHARPAGPPTGAPRPGAPGTPAAPRPARVPRSTAPTVREVGLVWLLVFVGVVMGVAMTQWPYALACGASLFVYLAAVLVLLLVGGWAAIEAWRCRIPSAHILALVITFWGIVLAAEVILPRIGYASVHAAWVCS